MNSSSSNLYPKNRKWHTNSQVSSVEWKYECGFEVGLHARNWLIGVINCLATRRNPDCNSSRYNSNKRQSFGCLQKWSGHFYN